LKSKIIVFVSSCKEVFGFLFFVSFHFVLLTFLSGAVLGFKVRYLYEMFRRLQPGIVLNALCGSMSQPKRMAVYYDFQERWGSNKCTMILFHHSPFLHCSFLFS
jgi:hypothetical protein